MDLDLTTLEKDLDLIAIKEANRLISAKPLPPGLLKEIMEVGTALELGEYWVNAGPTSLLEAGPSRRI